MTQLEVKKEDDGVFFMCFDDYINYYRSTTICKVHEDFHYGEINLKHKRGSYSLARFQLSKAS
jgi:hypothetical protein